MAKQHLINTKRYHRKRYASPPSITIIRNPVAEQTERTQWNGGSTYTFLNTTIDTNGAWFPSDASQLWVYNLHYFAFLFSSPSWEQCADVIRKWIDEVPAGTADAWHPYTISLRICNWIWAYSFFHAKGGAVSIDEDVCTSMYNQALYIKEFLERDVLGNHLVENCKALIVAGIFLDEPRFVTAGTACLRNQLREQVLDDGGHYERSPMYHCIVLEDCMGVYYAMRAAGNTFADEIKPYISRMADFLYTILERDGSFPLFNDSARRIAPDPVVMLDCLEKDTLWRRPPQPRKRLLQHSGLYVVRDRTLSLSVDCGACCPDFLPAHAHADMLSYTLFIGGVPVVTDSGAYQYGAGAWRDYFRSTRAHNTFMIDSEEQIECWGSFRVGRRGYPANVRETSNGIYAETTCYHFCGVHAAREISCSHDPEGITVTDTLRSRRNRHTYRSFIHFAPGISVQSRSDLKRALVTGNGLIMDFEAFGTVPIREEESWFSEEFGIKHRRLSLVLEGEFASDGQSFSYRIAKRNR
jgi:hypothetical protein